MREQHAAAVEHGLAFLRTRAEIREAVDRGHLVDLPGNEDYEVADFVDLPYALPASRLFVERTAALYRESCGQRLVVTSAVRAMDEQPWNAHPLSVHPVGMAIDLRVSPVPECRAWLESKMLGLEQRGVLNGIREFRPPHYHVAIYPSAYTAYVAEQQPEERVVEAPADPRRPPLGWIGVLVFFVGAAALVAWTMRRGTRPPPGPAG